MGSSSSSQANLVNGRDITKPVLKRGEGGKSQIVMIVSGAGRVGKTKMIQVSGGLTESQSIATVYDNYKFNMNVNEIEYELLIYDTAGQTYLQDITQNFVMPTPHINMLVFSLEDPNSFEQIFDRLIDLKNRYDRRAEDNEYTIPMIVLIGNKKDIRSDQFSDAVLKDKLNKVKQITSKMQIYGKNISLYITSCISDPQEVKRTLSDIILSFSRMHTNQMKRVERHSELVTNKSIV